jgi:hypothetical protein
MFRSNKIKKYVMLEKSLLNLDVSGRTPLSGRTPKIFFVVKIMKKENKQIY